MDGSRDAGSSSSRRRRKSSDPFYALPKDRDTVSEIINEARTSLKMVTTKRPFTPKESKRTLFGEPPGPTLSSRPPSSFSLNSKHFDPTDSRPPSGTKLSPLEHKPLLPIAPTSPAVGNPKRRSKELNERRNSAKGALRANSVDASSVNSLNVSLDSNAPIPQERRSDSAPKERPPICPTSSHGRNNNADSGYLTSESRGNSGGSENPKSSQHKNQQEPYPGLTAHVGRRIEELNKNERLRDSEYDVWSLEIEPILPKLVKDGCPRELLVLVNDLDEILSGHELYRERNANRANILKTVFKLLDIESAELQMKLAEVILKYRVSGNNLNNVCKLVFKLAKTEDNDTIFADSCILDLLLDVIVATEEQSYDVLVYVFGAVKFLSSNTQILGKLIDLGLIPTISNFLSNTPQLTGERVINILVQVTSCIRNIAEDPLNLTFLIRYKVFTQLFTILQSYDSQTEVTLNICRTLSRVVTNTECCNAITKCENWCIVLKSALKKHLTKANISVRIVYFFSTAAVSGNKAALSRELIFSECEHLLMDLLNHYLLSKQSEAGQDSLPNNETEGFTDSDEVLVKLMGLVANLSLSENIGTSLCRNSKFQNLVIKLIQRKPVLTHRELVLNSIVVLHNLSYFGGLLPNSCSIHENETKIAQLLVNVMMPKDLQSFDEHLEVMTECVRVYANLTRSPKVRNFMSENKIDLILFTLVDSGRRELLFNVIGVLVNMTLDSYQCDKISETELIPNLIVNLRDFGIDDWLLSSAVCKTFWNYLACCTNKQPISREDSESLKEVLNFLILEARSFKENATESLNETGDTKRLEDSEILRQVEEFLMVAGNLVQKLYGIVASF